MKNISNALFILILNLTTLHGQVFNNEVLQRNIRTVKFSPSEYDLGYPILSAENPALQLSFDIMDSDLPNLAYRFIHCNSNWESTKLPTIDYLKNSFNEFYVEEYEMSLATLHLYTHYEIPITLNKFKISGNYIIQVYDENNPENAYLQLRFIYAESNVNIMGKVEQIVNDKANSKQRVNFFVKYDKNKITSLNKNVKSVIYQNFRPDVFKKLKPLFITNSLLKFNYINEQNTFLGNNEFPYFDTSNINHTSHTVKAIEQDIDNDTHIYLYPISSATNNYFYIKDMNGNYAIQSENTFNQAIESEYVWVHFTFKGNEFLEPVYVVGRFNQWKANENNQLFYDDELGIYHIALLLKQGVYNYTFITKDTKGIQKNALGSYNETENDYFIFTYYYDESLKAERVIGWLRINSADFN